jgi:hypothetical protein
MRLMRIICIVALVVAVALPVYAEVQNVKVSGDILIRGVTRKEYDFLKDSTITGGNQTNASLYNTATRVQIDADLTDNVTTKVRLVNERDWDADAVNANDVNLDLANVTLKELIYSPLTVTLGRQDIKIGSGLVVADSTRPTWGNANTGPDGTLTAGFGDLSVRKAFDAIRGTLDYDNWALDAVIIKVNETNVATNDDDLFGVNATFKLDNKYNAGLQAYAFADRNESFNRQITAGDGTIRTYEKDTLYILGVKGTIDPIESLNLNGELAYQFGEINDNFIGGVADSIVDSTTDSRTREAWAVDVNGSYSWKDVKWTPDLGLSYAFRSGDNPGSSGSYNAWEPLFTDQVRGEIAKVAFNGANAGNTSNCHIIGAGLGVKPIEKLLVKLDYYHSLLDEKVTETATRANKTGLADEVDLGLTYNYTDDVTFGLLGAILVPGNSYKSTADDTAYETLGSVRVNF